MSEIDLTAPEVQAAIEAAVEKATAPLVAKRDELLGEVKKLRKNAEIDPADLERVENERDQLKQQLAEASKAAKKATAEAEAATKRAETVEGQHHKLLTDSALNEALAKVGVTDPIYQQAAKAMLAGQVGLVSEGDAQVVKAGDKALGDFITEWAGSDAGKRFVSAPDTTGGGSQNGGRGADNSNKGDAGGDKAARVARAAELLSQSE